jgi:prophage regulatory protein
VRIIRKSEVIRRVGYSETTLDRKERAGEFPKRLKLGPTGRAVGWVETEVDDYVAARVYGRDEAAS